MKYLTSLIGKVSGARRHKELERTFYSEYLKYYGLYSYGWYDPRSVTTIAQDFLTDARGAVGLSAFMEDYGIMSVARVERYEDGMWSMYVYPDQSSERLKMDEMPVEVRDHLCILLTAPLGFRDETIGRRLTDNVFWVFVKDGKEATAGDKLKLAINDFGSVT